MAKAQKTAKKKVVKASKKKIKKVAKKPVPKKTVVAPKKKAEAKQKPAASASKRPKRESTKKPRNVVTVKGYTESQIQQYQDWKKKLQAKSNAELKEMLKKNDQTSTGTKDELIEKIADGKVLGKIPRCTHCFGGRLRFDYKTGVYRCPGYRDDTDFHNCQKKYELNEVTRDAWND